MKISLIASILLAAGPAMAQDVEGGGELFRTFCATCHGVDATGGGPMAEMLAVAPPDLTALASSDGRFPTERVVFRIDGRDSLTAHGGPMPLFGAFFEGDMVSSIQAPNGQLVLTSQPVVDLVTWLQSVQAE